MTWQHILDGKLLCFSCTYTRNYWTTHLQCKSLTLAMRSIDSSWLTAARLMLVFSMETGEICETHYRTTSLETHCSVIFLGGGLLLTSIDHEAHISRICGNSSKLAISDMFSFYNYHIVVSLAGFQVSGHCEFRAPRTRVVNGQWFWTLSALRQAIEQFIGVPVSYVYIVCVYIYVDIILVYY